MIRIVLAILTMALALPALAVDEPQTSLTSEGLTLSEAGFGTAVVDRMLESKADSFQIGQRVYLWTCLSGGKSDDLVYHVWFMGDREIQSVELSVQGPHWRTWSYKTLFPGMVGTWRVEVQDRHGKVLGSHTFDCSE